MKSIVLAIALAAAPSIAFAAGDAMPLAPFHATYAAFRNGEELGTTTLDLAANKDGTWTLRSETNGTSGLAKLAGVHIVETSHFRWHDGRPEAIDYDYRQDSALQKRTRHAEFDQKTGTVRVEEGGKTFEYATAPGLIDRHAVTLALAADLKRGSKTFDYQVAVKDRIEDMRYERAGTEKLDVPAGPYDAVLVRRIGEPGTDRKRIARSWFAESIGWMPVQIEQSEAKGDTITLRLVSIGKR